MKFKVGDKVECIATGNGINSIGDTGVVVELNTTTVVVEWSTGGRNYILPERLKLRTPHLPINITFKNKYEHQAVQQFLFDNGYKWFIDDCREIETGYIGIDENRFMFDSSYNKEPFSQKPTFTINDLETIKEILNPSKPITEFKLNDQYTATIDPNTSIVKVGCQSFTFDKIKELAGKL